jgi:hypothetical protein
MRPIHVELAPPRAMHTRFVALSALALAMVIAVALLVAIALWTAREHAHELQSLRAGNVHGNEATVHLPTRQMPLVAPYAHSAHQMLRMQQADLSGFFAQFEVEREEGVILMELHLNGASNAARAEVEATDHGALLSFLELLNAGRETAPWSITSIRRQVNSGSRESIAASLVQEPATFTEPR